MTTIGQQLDSSKKNESKMKAYIDQISKLAKDDRLDKRTQFMLQDVVEMRRNKWKEEMAKMTYENNQPLAAAAEEEASSFGHHVVAMTNAGTPSVRGRSGTALGQTSSFRINSKAVDVFDPELGHAGEIVAPNTASKDKRHRAKPLGEALRSAMLRLPRHIRQGLVVYMAVVHVLLLVLLLSWVGGGSGGSDQAVLNPVVAHG